MVGLPDTIARKEDHMIDRDNIETDEEEFDEVETEDGEEETLTLGVGSTPVDFARLGITKMLISLSHTEHYACAQAIAIGEGP